MSGILVLMNRTKTMTMTTMMKWVEIAAMRFEFKRRSLASLGAWPVAVATKDPGTRAIIPVLLRTIIRLTRIIGGAGTCQGVGGVGGGGAGGEADGNRREMTN